MSDIHQQYFNSLLENCKSERYPVNTRTQTESGSHGVCGQNTLIEQLGATVNELRQISVDFGARPYRLFSVVTKIENGIENIISEKEFLPTPKMNFAGLTKENTSGGEKEQGSITVTEINPLYTEEEIKDMLPHRPTPTNVQTFIEVRVDTRDANAQRRRFRVGDVPYREADKFQWVAKLYVEQEPRNIDGSISNSTAYPKITPDKIKDSIRK